MTDDTEIDYDELADSIIDRLQSLGLNRRGMLKILAGGGAGALAMSAASPASAQQINGIIKADQLGTSSEPVKKLYVDEEYGNESYTSISAESASITNSVDAGSVSTDEASITGETYVEATRTYTTSAPSAGDFTNIIFDEVTDNNNELNSSLQFVPSETVEYDIEAFTNVDQGTAGDTYIIRLQNVTDGSTVAQKKTDDGGAFQYMDLDITTQLTSGKKYEVQISNQSSGYRMRGNTEENLLTIRKSVAHP